MKKLLALALASLMLISLVACGKDKENDDDQAKVTDPVVDELVFENFKYSANTAGMYEIVGYIPTEDDSDTIKIPATIDGRPVTGIAESAFKAAKYLEKIELPENIVYISDYAFYDCDYLTEIKLPSTLTTIGKGAFQDCDALVSVTLSENLTTIGEYAFMNCVALKNITLPATLVTISSGAFYNCDALTEVAIPESVRMLGDGAFHECSNLATITVPGTIPATVTVKDENGNPIKDENGEDKKQNVFGKSLFSKCAEELTVNTPEDSAFAKYVVDNNYNVKAPEAAPET